MTQKNTPPCGHTPPRRRRTRRARTRRAAGTPTTPTTTAPTTAAAPLAIPAPPFGIHLIAECGLNHDGSLERAHEMIRAAASAGATAVKFQKRSAARWFDDPLPRIGPRTHFGATHGDHRRWLEFMPDDHVELRRLAHSLGLRYGLSVWDIESATEALHIIRPDWIKLGRPFVITWRGQQVLHATARVLPPGALHVSCRDSVELAEVRAQSPDAVVYYCPGFYPDRDAHVRAATSVARLDVRGISLHTRTLDHAVEAVQAGARWVEYHVALAGTRHSDAAYSLDPLELARLVRMVRASVSAGASAVHHHSH